MDDELMPLTSAALMEEALFSANQTLAAQKGMELHRSPSGYTLTRPGVTRHFWELDAVADVVRGLHA